MTNSVHLEGTLSGDPEARQLPSEDEIVNFRVVVPRPQLVRGNQSVDVIDCVAYSPRTRRSVKAWRAGDRVEVTGSLRRRFYRAAGVTQSRVEVEIEIARVVRRAKS